tara:strand:- start:384 stop:560 length:177 start_codon:yes stop_codon:yes gene_type:complete
MKKMEELARNNKELAEELAIVKKQLNTAIDGLENIRDSYDPYMIAAKCLIEMEDLGHR